MHSAEERGRGGAVGALPRPRVRPSRRAVALAATVVLLVVLYLAAVPLLRSVTSMLVVEDELAPADLIVLLGGGIHARAPLAEELYRRGLAPRVLLARVEDSEVTRSGLYPNETDAAVRFLRRSGVPESALVVLRTPGGVASTQDEALALRAYLRDRPEADTVLVVTTRYHTRRARWMFRRVLQGTGVEVRMAGAPSPDFDERYWWRSEQGLVTYFQESVKFIHNWLYR